LYIQQRFFKKTWKTTPKGLAAAGAKFMVSENTKTKPKMFALIHVYEYVKATGKLSAEEAEEAVENEFERIEKTAANFKSFESGDY
ncbi:hypothetical protein EJ02DRAFT_303614, partial [Clathrospora elynae]